MTRLGSIGRFPGLLLRQSLSTWFRLGVSLAILAYLAFRVVDIRAAGRALVEEDPWFFLLALGLVAVDRLAMAVRWLILLRTAGLDVSFRDAGRIFLVSSFIGSFLPAGIGADASRAYCLAALTSRTSEVVASVVVDRLLGLVAIVLIGAAGLALWAQRMEAELRDLALVLALLVGLGVIAMFWIDRLVRGLLPAGCQAAGWGRQLIGLGDAVGRYRTHRGNLARVFALCLAVQITRVLQAYCLARGLGIAVGFLYYLVFMPIGLLMLLLPMSISGFGLPQGVMVWLLRPVGVPDAHSFALSTLIVIIGLAGNLPGLWLYVRPRAARTALKA